MKFFIDTADINEIRDAAEMGLVDGVTTNPTLIARTGKKFEEVISEICEIVKGPVNAEVIGLKADEMYSEGKKLAKLADNITIKIPMTLEGMKAVSRFSAENIKTNVTLIFSPTQALMAAKAGASFISPFVGRIDDMASDGMELIGQIVQIYDNYGFDTEVLVASIRNPVHVVEAALMGADVATIPHKVLMQLASHPLTDIGIEKFLQDWEKVPK